MKKISIILLYILFHQSPAEAQYIARRASQQQDLYHYTAAAALYEKAFKKKPTARNARAVATAYRQLRDYPNAEQWYAKLVSLQEKDASLAAEDMLNYAQALQQNAKYAEAKQQFMRCPQSATTTRYIAACDSALAWMQQPKPVNIINAEELNSDYTDWGAMSYSNQLLWVSDRPDSAVSRPFLRFSNGHPIRTDQYGWTGNNYLKLYAGNALFDRRGVNSAYHTGMPAISPDGLELYFTRTRNIKKSRKFLQKDDPYTINVEMFMVKRETATSAWSDPVPFRYNNALEYSVGDPFISKDGKRLYFISDKPGGLGSTDIYYCDRAADGSWGDAVNMGDVINTAGNERCPATGDGDVFYFSSDGHPGMGGLDIFTVTDQRVINAGYPLNSAGDDFYMLPLEDGTKGYFTSNRPGGKGKDDIYRFEKQPEPVEPAPKAPDTSTVITSKIPDPLPLQQPIRIIIYYDFDKWNIRKEAATELDQLARTLQENPTVVIQLSSHTDSRGNNAYNLRLSERRAASAVKYLEGKGIDPKRMQSKGYGETKPVNDCRDGVRCTEAQHQENRRTEFEVLSK